MDTLSTRFAKYISELEYERLPDHVKEKLRSCVLYQLGIGLAGFRLASPVMTAELVARNGGAGQATLLLGGQQVPATEAAFANGILFHARVQDDTHHTSHLGTVLIAAGLAVAEEEYSDGKSLMTALAAGYEVAAVLGETYTECSTPRGFRASGIYGVLGAAAVASRLYKLDVEQTASALGIAATMAGGTIHPFAAGTEEFVLHNGQAARNGVLAARYARSGLRASVWALEGKSGFLEAFAGGVKGDSAIIERLKASWRILNVNFKFLPVCAGNQAPIANARELASKLLCSPSNITEVKIHMNSYEANHPGIANYGPFNSRVETLMSTPFCVALALTGHPISMENLQLYDDADVLKLVRSSQICASKDLPMLHSEIQIRTSDGAELKGYRVLSDEEQKLSFSQTVRLVSSLRDELPFEQEYLDFLVDKILNLDSEIDLRRIMYHLAVKEDKGCHDIN